MTRRRLAVVAVTLTWFATASSLPGEEAPRPSVPADPGLTDGVKKQLGAAALIPADAFFFSSSLALAEQWRAITESKAWKQHILILPGVQLLLGQLRQTELYRAYTTRKARDPLLLEAVEVGLDAISNEVFVYGDARVRATVDTIVKVYLDLFTETLKTSLEGRHDNEGQMVAAACRAILSSPAGPLLPGFALGFRLSKPDRCRKLIETALERWKEDLPRAPRKEELGGGTYHTWTIRYSDLPEEDRQEIDQALASSELTPEERDHMSAYLARQTLALSIGLRGDYLLISLGADTSHLAALGGARSLAAEGALAPVRRRLKPGLVGLSYIHEALTTESPLPLDKFPREIRQVVALHRKEIRPETLERLEKDLRALIEERNTGLFPATKPVVAATFLNRGLETFTFQARGKSQLALDRPLKIFSHAGDAPLLAIASRAPPSLKAYGRLVHWIRTAYGYCDELLVPASMTASDREAFERFKGVLVPAFKSLHETTEQLMFPALDGAESLWVLDGGGKLGALWGPLPRPLIFPRPVFVVATTAGESLRKAFSSYRTTINDALVKTRKNLEVEAFQIPEAARRDHAGGSLYSYGPLPFLPGAELEPHALLAEGLAMIGLSPDQSSAVAAAAAAPVGEVVDLAGPAGLVFRLDVSTLTQILAEDLTVVVSLLAQQEEIPRPVAGAIFMHLPDIAAALGTLRTFSGRLFEAEDGFEVLHAWLHVKDVESP